VEGLSFDFVGLNFTGGLAYAVFNIGLYAIPSVMVSRTERSSHACTLDVILHIQ
jgi:hypothetical protein